MSALDTGLTAPKSTQPGSAPAQQPVQPGQSPATTNVPGLPPTAVSQQMQSVNEQYQAQQASLVGGGGAAPQAGGMGTAGPVYIEGRGPEDAGAGGGADGGLGAGQFGRSSLQDMAERLAKGYGLEFGRGSLVDESGNFMATPDQLAGGNMGLADTAASMNYVAQAINDRRIEQQQNKATAALQTGMGLIQSRGRGSLAAMQSGFFQSMADNYTNPNLLPEQQDFSYWIQKQGMEQAMADREEEREASGGGGGGLPPIESTPTQGDPLGSTDAGPRGKGDVVTSGPNEGMRPVYEYDPLNKITHVRWESA